MNILKGKPVCEAIDHWTSSQIQNLKSSNISPTLGIIRVGKREDDLSYEKSVKRKCEKLGLGCRIFEFPEDILNEEFLEEVAKVNSNQAIHGILMFRPLPNQINYKEVLRRTNPQKDIDGMHPENLGLVLSGDVEGFAPCTAEAVVEILKFYEISIKGSTVSIVNRSSVVGKPLAMMLTGQGATTTICHSQTKDLAKEMKSKDIVVAAVGKANFFNEDNFSPGQIVIDVGINIDDNGYLCGDVDFDKVIAVSAGLTPVPGGVGGVTTSLLLRNVVKACTALSYKK